MKLVFLDFDGVLNSEAFFKTYHRRGNPPIEWIDPAAVTILDEVVTRSSSRVIISSTWRLAFDFDEVIATLREKGFRGEVVGRTGKAKGNRGLEIGLYLATRERAVLQGLAEPLESFVIVDDDADMGPLLPRLVKTDYRTGLQRHHVEPMLTLLDLPLAPVRGS